MQVAPPVADALSDRRVQVRAPGLSAPSDR